MKTKIKPSSVEDCVRYMGEPKVVICLDFINAKGRGEIESYLRTIAERNGYPSIVLKRESGRLYAF